MLRTLAGMVTLLMPCLAFAQVTAGDVVVLTRPVNNVPASIVRLDPTTPQTPVIMGHLPQAVRPRDIAVLPNGSLLILDADWSGATGPQIPGGKGPGGLFIFDPVSKGVRHLATPQGCNEPLGMALLSTGQVIITDAAPAAPGTDGAGPAPGPGRLYRVDASNGISETLLQSARLLAPGDVAAYANGDLLIADTGGFQDPQGAFVSMGPGMLFRWIAETGELVPFSNTLNVRNPRRVDVSPWGTAVLGMQEIAVQRPMMALFEPLNTPRPAQSFTDIEWAPDGRLLLLHDDVNGEGAIFVRDQWNQAQEIARSPLLGGAVALAVVQPKIRRAGILENAVARGVSDPVWVDVALTNITNLGALDIRIDYDPAQAMAGRPQAAPASSNYLLSSNLAPGSVSFSLVIDDFAAPSEVPAMGHTVVARIPFNLNNTLGNDARIRLIINRATLAAYDNSVNVEAIPLEPVDGNITVIRGLAGDINNDGDVNSGDAVLALQSGAGQRSLTPVQAARGDINRDGRVNSGDALLILRTSTGLRNQESF